MSKRILVTVLTVCLAVVGMTVMAFADTVSGNGWSLDTSTGVLTISSDAGMTDWTDNGRNTYGSSVKSADIQSGVTDIDDYAFYYYCTNLESVSIPDTVTTIGEAAFNGCESLTSITIPDSVKTISKNAFYCCVNLAAVTLGNSVETIGKGAFDGCESLTSITIPDNVKTIDESAFAYTSLTSIVIPDSVTTLGIYALSGCTSLTSATIGSGITVINSDIFNGCTSLATVCIIGNVTEIGNRAFKGCSSITDVYYSGDATAWSNIEMDSRGSGWHQNTYLLEAFIHYNCTSTSTHTLSAEYTWKDVTGCTVTLTCSCTGSKEITAEITSDIVAATCTEDGKIVYIATATYGGVTYTDTKSVASGEAALGHNLTKTEAVAATCTTDGNIEYWYCSTCEKYFSDEDCTTGILLTDTVIAPSHSYYVSSCTWYDNYTSATLKLVCDSCGDEIEIDATEITSEEDGSGNVVYKATVRYGNINYSQMTTVEAEEKSSSKSDPFTTLSRIQASYTGVQAAIAKANALNPDDYENFSAVTEAIEAVNWSLSALNQKQVNSYAEAIEEAIENLIPVETVDIEEKAIEIVDPVEAGDTDIE